MKAALLFLAAAIPVLAQTPPDAAGIRAVITSDKNVTSNALALRYTPAGLAIAAGTAGTITLPGPTLSRVEFELPDPLARASRAYLENDLEAAAPLYEQSLPTLKAFAATPNSNMAKELIRAIDTLRQLGRIEAAEKLITESAASIPKTHERRLLLLRISLLLAAGKSDEAAGLLRPLAPAAAGDDGFVFDRVVRCRVLLSREKHHEAALMISEGLSGSGARLESPHYPEALFLAAECYEQLSQPTASTAPLESAMNASFDAANTRDSALQQLALVFPGSYWAKRKPVDVGALLASAAADEGQVPEEKPAAASADPAASPTPAPEESANSWDAFQKKPNASAHDETTEN